MFLAHLSQSIGRRWQDRRAFADFRSYALSIYDTAVRYFPRAPFPGRGAVRTLRYANVEGDVHIRVGSSDAAIAEEIFVRHVYAALVDADVGSVKTIIDLGANVGMTVRLWSSRFKGAKIVAVEPDPSNIAVARRNGSAPGATVDFVQACVAAEPGTVSLDREADECAYRMTREKSTGLTVPALTMQNLIEKHFDAGADVDLLKCDIEGAEQEVFGRCAGWINRVRLIVIELHQPYTPDMLLADIARNGGSFSVVRDVLAYGNHVLTLRRNAH